MASSGNFTKWSPLFKDTNLASLKEACTRFDGTTNATSALTDFAIPVGTKFYAEVIAKLGSNYYNIFGIAPPDLNLATYARNLANVYGIEQRTNPGAYTINSISNTTVGSDSSSQGDLDTQVLTYGIAVNRVDNEVKLYLDNTLKFTLSIPSTGEFHFMCSFTGGNNATSVHYNFNGGHDSTGAGDKTAASNTDENGFGEFQYSPPSGHLACCSANLPTSSDIDPGGDNGADENPTKQFGVLTYSGGTSGITGLGFQPDLVWIKRRSDAQSNGLFDSSRGTSKVLNSDGNSAEATSSGLTSFDSDGYTMGTFYNQSSYTYVSWCWKANGGTTASNGSGSITSTVQANTKAGFSIVTYTGNDGSWGSGNRDTFGHGLSAAPELIFIKETNSVDQWTVFHAHVGNGGGSNAAANNLVLNTSAALYTNQSYKSFGETMPTSTLVTVEGNTTNSSSSNHVAYCWHSVDGYSKFGSFEGNSNNDGPFIYTGFRPRLLFIKNIDSTSPWGVYDGERPGFNDCDLGAWDESTALDNNIGAYPLDILSNGFKLKTSNATVNSSHTWVYGAWADVPAKYNNAF
tara:strand:- start:1011 stop:2732 length:1722 start_codon:yes stop_codon:yes gene_type:complete